MSTERQAIDLATTLFNEGNSLEEVRAALYIAFGDDFRFYEAGGFLYMEDDDGRFPPIRLCEACKE